jgi:hypothetical protein
VKLKFSPCGEFLESAKGRKPSRESGTEEFSDDKNKESPGNCPDLGPELLNWPSHYHEVHLTLPRLIHVAAATKRSEP